MAYRRKAKEVHPDVSKEDDAHDAFLELSEAYEVLSDPARRRQYDAKHRVRRANFFQDLEEDDEDGMPRASPFGWSRVRQDAQPRQAGWGLRPDDDDYSEDGDDGDDDGEGGDEEGGGAGRARRGRAGGPGADEDEDDEEAGGPDFERAAQQAQFLQDLAKYMSGGSLREYQSGRLDPWGTSTSDSWFKKVEKQMGPGYGRPSQGRPGYGDGDGGGGMGREWDPSKRPPGWTPPGRGSEWSHPRRQWDEADRRGPGQTGGGGDFRRPPRS